MPIKPVSCVHPILNIDFVQTWAFDNPLDPNYSETYLKNVQQELMNTIWNISILSLSHRLH